MHANVKLAVVVQQLRFLETARVCSMWSLCIRVRLGCYWGVKWHGEVVVLVYTSSVFGSWAALAQCSALQEGPGVV